MNLQNIAIAWAPLLPWPAISVLAAAAAMLLAVGWIRRARGMAWRTLVFTVLLLTLANPSAVLEDRSPLDDVGVVVVDDSPSQGIGDRHAQTEAALAKLKEQAKALKHFELRVVRTTGQDSDLKDSGTRLFKALDEALADIPRQRFAGAVMITDGQVHDVPTADAARQLGAPLHALLTGTRNEGDRRLTVVKAPGYGLVGKQVTLTVRVDDLPASGSQPGGQTRLAIRHDGGAETSVPVPIGEDAKIPLVLDHAGQNIFELSVEQGPRELTLLNNRAVAVVNGVRDRLRVLLVSGEPYPGERALRNILKSDPSVDLVHFTILRPPEKLDATPVRELSLITFPVHELFDIKLKEFDLIIFDRYRRRGELPNNYLQNIVDYVKNGGALLVSVGPSFASPLSVFYTPLSDVIPAEPTGQVIERGFRPKVTELGKRHPVTADLPGADDPKHPWGRWFREVPVRPKGGLTLMSGSDGSPLLQLQRIGKGRVAMLASDQMWLWSRGFEGGGPEAEILRRLGHWLMKEPELEEEALQAEVDGNRIKVIRRSLDPKPVSATVTAPSGKTSTVPLKDEHGGRSSATLTADELGLYRISDGKHIALAAVGPLNPLEFRDVRATGEKLEPAAQATGGSVRWLAEGGVPELRQIGAARGYAGAGVVGSWVAFKSNGDYVVTGVRQAPLLPALLVLLTALATLALAWRREGQ